ncbi:hypothetical protein ONZ45_g2928 [Pleurotus djamor]|nr:hypothetical protein ONZ45_g2928 [Pleurotus djamor]
MFPKIIALDTDWTIFWGWLDGNKWGKGPGAASTLEDNIKQKDFWDIYDKTNPKNKCGMFADVPDIIGDILKNGAKLAIVSRNKHKSLCDRALWHWKAQDGKGGYKPIIELVTYNEIYDKDPVTHFNKIHSYDTNVYYSDMLYFDDDATSNIVEMMIGVTFQVSRDQKGLTWANYKEGLEVWRRNKSIITPWKGLKVSSYPKAKFIGYSGMDIDTIKLLEKGWRRHDRKEAARYGFAVYIADNPAIAEYFNRWIKYAFGGESAETVVCKLYARDGEIWDKLNKIWVADDTTLKTDEKGKAFDVAWSQEDRDRLVASWGVHKPYVLFSRHPNMDNWKQPNMTPFPVPDLKRWNEMVVYPQIQEAQLLAVRMSQSELEHDMKNGVHLHYEKKLKEWNIKTPHETLTELGKYGESSEFH